MWRPILAVVGNFLIEDYYRQFSVIVYFFYLFLGAKTTIGEDGMPCSVIHFFIHPHYNPFIFPGPYDIALIRLSRGLQIAPVRLPVSGAPINDAECWIAGYHFLITSIATFN